VSVNAALLHHAGSGKTPTAFSLLKLSCERKKEKKREREMEREREREKSESGLSRRAFGSLWVATTFLDPVDAT
jgi:hypothetical protein